MPLPSRHEGGREGFWSKIEAAEESHPLLAPMIIRGLCAAEAQAALPNDGDGSYALYCRLLRQCVERGIIKSSDLNAIEMLTARKR